ncbi:hypothetical protein IE53DRAFT_389519 [Violaceomyces palustris]|uniref:Uncharacterized protein n=1 Tax=Violaceomyces palustris TaxID=1673888 RepID=A0ACD0NR62_9BASI|nr:hypothetical protein IE53DRAFT_389519 [Violaceomyces palustris]
MMSASDCFFIFFFYLSLLCFSFEKKMISSSRLKSLGKNHPESENERWMTSSANSKGWHTVYYWP